MSMVFAGFMGAAREDRLEKEKQEAIASENAKDREWELKKYNLTKVEEQRAKDAELAKQVDALIESHPQLSAGHRAFLTRQLDAGFSPADISEGILSGRLALTGGSSGSPTGTPSSGVVTGPNSTPEERKVAYRNGIAAIESDGSGGYQAVGATHPELGRALGRYQIMEANIPSWSKAALGREVTVEEFMAKPEIQDAIFDHRFGQYVEKYGEEKAARAWFGGEGGIDKPNRTDVHGKKTIATYGTTFMENIGGPEQLHLASAGSLDDTVPDTTPASADTETEEVFGGSWVPKPDDNQLEFDNQVIGRLASASSIEEANRHLVGNLEQMSPDGQRRAEALMAAREAEAGDPDIADKPEDLATMDVAALDALQAIFEAQGEPEKAEKVGIALERKKQYEDPDTATSREDPVALIGAGLQEKRDWWTAVGQNLPEDDPRRATGKAMLDAHAAIEQGEGGLKEEELFGKPLDQLAAIEQDLRRNGKVDEANRVQAIRTDREAYTDKQTEKDWKDLSKVRKENYVSLAAAAREAGDEAQAREIENIGRRYEEITAKATGEELRIKYTDNDGNNRTGVGVRMDDGSILVRGQRIEDYEEATPMSQLEAAEASITKMQSSVIEPLQDARLAAGDLLDSGESLAQIVEANPEVLLSSGGQLSSVLSRLGAETDSLFQRLKQGESVEQVARDFTSTLGGNTASAQAYSRYVAESLRMAYVYASSGLGQSGQSLSDKDFQKAMGIIVAGHDKETFKDNLRDLIQGSVDKLDQQTSLTVNSPAMKMFENRYGEYEDIMGSMAEFKLDARGYFNSVGLDDELAWLEGPTTEAAISGSYDDEIMAGGTPTPVNVNDVANEYRGSAVFSKERDNYQSLDPEGQTMWLNILSKKHGLPADVLRDMYEGSQ